MHTFKTIDENATTFTYNQDASGDVIIDNRRELPVAVSMKEILEFVAHVIRNIQISKLEEATVHELLKLPEDFEL